MRDKWFIFWCLSLLIVPFSTVTAQGGQYSPSDMDAVCLQQTNVGAGAVETASEEGGLGIGRGTTEGIFTINGAMIDIEARYVGSTSSQKVRATVDSGADQVTFESSTAGQISEVSESTPKNGAAFYVVQTDAPNLVGGALLITGCLIDPEEYEAQGATIDNAPYTCSPTSTDPTTTGTDADGDGVGNYGVCQRTIHINPDGSVTYSNHTNTGIQFGDPDDEDPNTPIPPAPTQPCEAQAGTEQWIPTGNTRQTDNDGDGVPREEYQEQRYVLDAECNLIPTSETRWTDSGGPDPDDNDPNNPGGGTTEAPCLTITGTIVSQPTGNFEDRDEDGDEVPRRWYEYQDYAVNPDCSLTPLGTPYYQDSGGPDPDDTDQNNPNPTQDAPDLQSYEHAQHELKLSVSHAQCAGDATAFALSTSDSGSQGFNLTLVILDDDGDIHQEVGLNGLVASEPNRLFQYGAVFNPGTYAAIAYGDISRNQLQTEQYFDTVAFTVPAYGCQGFLPADRAALLADIEDLLIASGDADLNLAAHRENSLEIMGMEFDGITFAQLVMSLLWLLVLWWSLRKGYVLPAIIATVMVPAVYIDALPSPIWGFTILVIVLWLEAFSTWSVFKRWITGKEQTQ